VPSSSNQQCTEPGLARVFGNLALPDNAYSPAISIPERICANYVPKASVPVHPALCGAFVLLLRCVFEPGENGRGKPSEVRERLERVVIAHEVDTKHVGHFLQCRNMRNRCQVLGLSSEPLASLPTCLLP